jgi:hypothetical protein
MVNLGLEAHLGEALTHGRAHVMEAVHRRNGEVATLHARAVAHVPVGVDLLGVPVGLFGVDLVERPAHVRAVTDVIEYEELVLRAEIGHVANAGGLQIGLGALSDGTRIAAVTLHGIRLDDVADQNQRGVIKERIQHRRIGIRHQDHVRLVNALPALDRGAIEHFAFRKRVRINGMGGQRHVL